MAYKVLKVSDNCWGSNRLEHVTLNPAPSDYPLGGYFLQGESGVTENTGNVGLAKVGYVIPCGGQGGYSPVWNPVTAKLQIFQDSSAIGPQTELLPGTDISSYSFNLLVIGY